MSKFYNFKSGNRQDTIIKNNIDDTLNSFYYNHYNTEANTNPNTNINSFNTSHKNYNENQIILSNYNNHNNESIDNYEDEKIDENDKSNSSKLNDNEAPTNIDEIIKNEISSSVIDSFLNQHQIKSIPMFILYLSEIWQELSKETNPSLHINVGINLFSFIKYYNLPGLIGQRLFDVLDLDNNGFLSPSEFITGMCTLFCEEINSLIKFIFYFCDFDKDDYITFDDMHAVLSYLPIINGFDDMIDIEEEIYSTIQDIFINKKEKIDYNTFYDLIIRKERYELFIPLISFFYENKPFNNEEINEFYIGYYNIGKINANEGKYQISNVVSLKECETKEDNKNDDDIEINSYKDDFNFNNYKTKNILFGNDFKNYNFKSNISEVNVHLNNLRNSLETKNLPKKEYEQFVLKSHGFEQMRKSIPLVISSSYLLNSKKKNNLKNTKNLVDLKETKFRFEKTNKTKYYRKRKSGEGSIIYSFCQNIMKGSCMTFNNKIDNDTDEYDGESLQKSVSVKMDTNLNNFRDMLSWKNSNNLLLNNQRIKCESYLYKITKSGKLKKLYFKLNNQDLFYYKNENSQTHKGMHNLSTYFLEIKQPNLNNSIELSNSTNISSIKEENLNYTKIINGVEYYCFFLINIKKEIHSYYTPDYDIYKKWVDALKILLKYKNIYGQYIFREIIGKGKNCIVFYAYDTFNKRNVAIKRINKTLLSLEDLSLIQTETDTLKVCQHPYVVKLYEIIETYNEINIILEHCELGNLYYYLSKNKFNLTEEQIVTYIHDISKAVYSMHNLGIIHRDLKLSNIALTNHNGKIEIRILDFGLSKILGPNQYCNEGYGTPGYAAPEVISRYDYSFEADVWSIGVITYFLCERKLPFDYIRKGCDEKDVIENTLLDEVKFDYNIMSKYSKYAIKFIRDLMNKNTFERPNIKEVLEHEWFQLFFKNVVKKRKIDAYKNEFYENPDIEENYTCDENIEKSKQNRTNFLLYTSINNK